MTGDEALREGAFAHARAAEWGGAACMAAALLAGIGQGGWETLHPIVATAETYAAAGAVQRWGYGLLAVVKSLGFVAGLYTLYAYGTRRGIVVKLFMALASAGAAFFAAVWLYMAWTRTFTLLYVAGGAWYQMFAPVALGIAGLAARRLSMATAIGLVIVGVLNSQIFVLLSTANALLVQGVLWLWVGYAAYRLAHGAAAPPAAAVPGAA